ncbi:MAG TPA: DUF4384 domain-containing protein [Pirellulales bacterium]
MRSRLARLVLFGCLAMGLLAALPGVGLAAESTFRDLVRKYVAEKAKGEDPPKPPGLPADIKTVLALEYTVLLRRDDKEMPVNAETYMFEIGDRIRVRVKPVNQLYIYIFYQGASGQRSCLLPTEKEKPPLAGAGQTLELPNDGSVCEFTPPAGDEKLIVVATEQPSDDLAALASVVFKKPEEQLTAAEKLLHDSLKVRSEKKLKSIRERQAQGTRYRGLFDEEALTQVSQEMARKRTTRAVFEEPPSDKQPSTFSMSASVGGDGPLELFVTIPLKSIQAGPGSKR